jgi:hypothetical protein
VNDDELTAGNLEVEIERARSVKRKHETKIMSKVNVVGVGVGLHLRKGEPTGKVGLVVFVDRKVPASKLGEEDIIPTEIDGVPVDVQEIGQIRPMDQAGRDATDNKMEE